VTNIPRSFRGIETKRGFVTREYWVLFRVAVKIWALARGRGHAEAGLTIARRPRRRTTRRTPRPTHRKHTATHTCNKENRQGSAFDFLDAARHGVGCDAHRDGRRSRELFYRARGRQARQLRTIARRGFGERRAP